MLKETPIENGVQLSMFFLSKQNNGVAYEFEMIPDPSFKSITEIVQDLMRQMYTGEIEIPDEDKTDVMRSITIGSGEMAADDRNYGDDIENKIVFHMINGTVLMTDARQIKWDEQVKNISRMDQTGMNIRALIHALVTRETIEVPVETDENTEGEKSDEQKMVERNTVEFAREEIAKYSERNNISIDYSKLENNGTITDRELLIIKLVDLLEINQQMISATLSVVNQQNVAAYYERRIADMTGETPAEPAVPAEESIEEVDAEVVSEG